MRSSRARSVAAVVAAGLLVSAACASASAAGSQMRLPTGSTRYVRIVRLRGGDRTVVLTSRGRRALGSRLRGHVLDATCTTLGRSVHGLTVSSGESSASEGQSSVYGHFTYHTLLDPHADFCDIGLARETHNGVERSGVLVAFDSIALDQKGAVFLDEDRVTQRLTGVLELATALASRDPGANFPTAEKLSRYLRGRYTSLASVSASPPPGRVGYFSDAAGHVEVVALSALGRRLFIDIDDGVLSTDVSEHLIRIVADQAATLSG